MRYNFLYRHAKFLTLVGFLLLILSTKIYAQCPTSQEIWNEIETIESNPNFNAADKLNQFYLLKKNIDKCSIHHDSAYARLLLKIGAYEFDENRNYTAGIYYTENSIKINLSGEKGASKYFAIKGYYTLGYYFNQFGFINKALTDFDSLILVAASIPDTTNYILYSKLSKSNIYFKNGDYQKAIEESISGMNYSALKKDSLYFTTFLNQKAQSHYFKNDLEQAFSDVNVAINISKKRNELFELATALKTKAFISEKKGNFFLADSLFKEAIKTRIETEDLLQIATDYNDYGNFYLDSLRNYNNAIKNYLLSIDYGKKAQDAIALARANINIGSVYLNQKKFAQAAGYCVKALKYLNISSNQNIFDNPTAEQMNAVPAKELALVIMNSRIQILYGLYQQNKQLKELNACLKTCFVMDTLIFKMRSMQLGDESKLYWRDYTRSFYENAIEVCYLAKDPKLAFYFMEKSRAALLNDKLNELNASSYLSLQDAAKQESFEVKLIELEQKLSQFSDTSKQYQSILLQYLSVKNNFEQFIKSLERNYPAYYQYKYADDVFSLEQLQKFMAKNNQSFVHYFFGDTATYILAVTSNSTNFIRLSANHFNKEKLSEFLQFCANKQMLNSNYGTFAELSNSIYIGIFQQLHLPKGRVVICTDNIVIPFEALCSDKNGKNYLLNDYSFSYVYSARFLMKEFNNALASGNFVGYAPVSFASYLGVQSLKNAADALHASAVYYKNDKLFTNENATKSNFFKYASSYSVISIFSHAKADTTQNEPILYMQDSVIRLSELQLMNNPATKLVLLSACQTNVGKNATGEGIYSLARGFATAGIPSVSATLWKADEETIYAISQKFNEYLSQGMKKDEALQKAKLYFIQNNADEKLLPFYWANMIVIGNTDAIEFTKSSSNTTWHFIYCCIAIVLAFVFIYTRRKITQYKRSNNIS